MEMKNIVYVRVSTGAQDTAAQLSGIREYMGENIFLDALLIEDSCSGSVPWKKRDLVSVIGQANRGDRLIVSELSRLGRSTSDVLDFIRTALEAGLQVHVVKGRQVLDESISSKIWRTVMALMAEIERDFTVQRTKEGLAAAVERGAKLGRPPGAAVVHQLDEHRAAIVAMQEARVGRSAIARMLGVSRATYYRWLALEKERKFIGVSEA